jgi:RNA recognition motif-containing protein
MALADPLPAAQKIAGPDEVTTHRLYIGGLAENVTRDELEQRFKSFGKIVSTELLNDKLTGMKQCMYSTPFMALLVAGPFYR